MPKPTKRTLDEAIKQKEAELRKLRKQRIKLDEGKGWCLYGTSVRRISSLPIPDRYDMQPRFATKLAALKNLLLVVTRDLKEDRRDVGWAQARVAKRMRAVARVEDRLAKENAKRTK
jgi:hypothetical protein